ncbi:hypothetical protein COMA2_20274 [Candidatus Nitrospira nitrificans]|uniref:Uncharacterized protein n=1 Tax=Candidatus Nitrospira nitrificans TaxID=1742973 RepID=A0A0S4LF04_9BACT|nr:hypothetical protein COMA2_20274 [Candidatus Nitrospira nitrificans]
MICIERFGQKFLRAQLHGFHSPIDRAEGSHDHHGGATGSGHCCVTRQLFHDIYPAQFRHLKIQEDDIGIVLANYAKRFLSVRSGLALVTEPFKAVLQTAYNISVVIDDQNSSSHQRPPASKSNCKGTDYEITLSRAG